MLNENILKRNEKLFSFKRMIKDSIPLIKTLHLYFKVNGEDNIEMDLGLSIPSHFSGLYVSPR